MSLELRAVLAIMFRRRYRGRRRGKCTEQSRGSPKATGHATLHLDSVAIDSRLLAMQRIAEQDGNQ